MDPISSTDQVVDCKSTFCPAKDPEAFDAISLPLMNCNCTAESPNMRSRADYVRWHSMVWGAWKGSEMIENNSQSNSAHTTQG